MRKLLMGSRKFWMNCLKGSIWHPWRDTGILKKQDAVCVCSKDWSLFSRKWEWEDISRGKSILWYVSEVVGRILLKACAVLGLVTQSRPTLCNPMGYSPPGSFDHGDSPGKNTGAGCHALLQGIFPTQGLNPGFLHCRQILYHLKAYR